MNELLKKEIDLLPENPGCYQMRDVDDKIIYVGKAKNLKKRVSQYFLRPQNGKTARMVMNVHHFTTIITKTEKEALILEMNLIQKYHPQFNILLMDDKHYPYIALHKNIEHPYVSISRNIKDKRCEFFGPFPNSGACYKTLDIINKTFPLRKCHKLKKKSCLYYHMGQCLGPCINHIERKTYDEICNKISDFLKGDNKEIIKILSQKMDEASSKLEFEKALEYKNIIQSILQTSENQVMEFKDKINCDVFSFSTRDFYISISVLIVRNGVLTLKKSFVYEIIGEINDFISNIILQYYDSNTLPKQLIVPNEEILNNLNGVFTECAVSSPTKGKFFELLNIAKINSLENLNEHFQTARLEDDNLEVLENLGKMLNIKTPYQIELYDNSHLMGSNAVGAMVCFINGEPVKKMYRRYNLDTINTQDDLMSMNYVLTKRFKRLKEENLNYPDLIILDGGMKQLNVAIDVFHNLNININAIGLVKNNKHQTEGIVDKTGKIYNIKDNKKLFFLLARMQDEVHRFAISFHKSKRLKNMYSSIFDEVEGIGDGRVKIILEHYPTIEALKMAPVEELEQILPKKVAKDLFNKFHE